MRMIPVFTLALLISTAAWAQPATPPAATPAPAAAARQAQVDALSRTREALRTAQAELERAWQAAGLPSVEPAPAAGGQIPPEQARRLQDLVQRQNEQIDRLASQNARLQEQLATAQAELSSLRAQVNRTLPLAPPAPAPAAPPPPAAAAPAEPAPDGPVVSGQVIAVEGEMVQVSIGSQQGIQTGMRLMLYRGPDFVAFVEIVTTTGASSAGTIISRKLDPRIGDRAAPVGR